MTTNSLNNTIFNNDFSVNRSTAGTPVVDSTIHTSAAAGSTAIKRQQVPDAAVADPFIIHATATTRSWVHGMDTSDGTSLKEGTSAVGVTTPSTATITRRVSTAGEQTMPLQPAFSAYLSVDQLNVTGNNTNYTVICDTEVVDQGGDYNNVTGTFTAPITGVYYLNVCVRFGGLTATHTGLDIQISINAAATIYNNISCSGAAVRDIGNFAGFDTSVVVLLTAGDTANCLVNVRGGALVVDIIGAGARRTTFSGCLIC